MGMKPKKECRYELVQMMPVQKLDGGYLFTEDPRVDDGAGSGQGVGVAFLRTDKDFPQGSYITGVALYTGSYTYEALDGFPKKVFAFELAK
jgi:hypothetical protein